MSEALVVNWNNTVSDNDTVWVLGDFGMGKIMESLQYVLRLNGTKILVPGNHDRCWTGNRKGVEKWRQIYLDAGFADIVDSPEPHRIASRSLELCHFPYAGDSHDEDRFVNHRPEDRGAWLLHGHVHEAWRQRGRQINVGVDAWGGAPVSADTIAELIEQGPQDLAPLEWVR